MKLLAAIWAAYAFTSVPAQNVIAKVQNNTFNATHGRLNAQTALKRILEADLGDTDSQSILTALNFERSNWAGTSARLDPFYADLPNNWTNAAPGSIVKIEHLSNTTLFTIPPTLALSRFIYTTKNTNGTLIPASAFVLWPYMPKTSSRHRRNSDVNEGSVPVVAWAHGTSGWSGECGPSHMRNLYYQFRIFATASQGYAVVAPDFAGLGLDHDGRGNHIAQEYLSNIANGYDTLYAVRAARSAWKRLTTDYVIMGHSQGGGVAWGAAIALAEGDNSIDDLRHGYLGTVALAPHVSFHTTTSIQPDAKGLGLTLSWIATGMKSIFPSFTYNEWLTDRGVRKVELLQDLQGCQPVAKILYSDPDLVRDDWNSSWYGDAFHNLTYVAGRDFAGPMLVVQGSEDTNNPVRATLGAVNTTCDEVASAQIEYVELEGVTHGPLMFAGQQVYLDWIADRFAGRRAKKGCHFHHFSPPLPWQDYQLETNWFMEWSQYIYTS